MDESRTRGLVVEAGGVAEEDEGAEEGVEVVEAAGALSFDEEDLSIDTQLEANVRRATASLLRKAGPSIDREAGPTVVRNIIVSQVKCWRPGEG